jgi:hypothetical protein
VRFLYAVTLGRETVDLMASVPHMKRATRRAEVYGRSEIEAILTAPTMEYWATIAEDVISKQSARSLSATGAPWSFSRRALWIRPVAERVVRCAEKPEFACWPLPMPPAFCT